MEGGLRLGNHARMTRFRRGFVWLVISLLVFMLVATLVLDGAA
jgi:hypothetical protein